MRRPFLTAILGSSVLLLGCGDDGGSGGSGGAGGSGGSGGGATTTDTSAGGAGGTTTTGSDGGAGGSTTTTTTAGECGEDTSAPDEVLEGTTDPEAGDFTLDEALAGLPEGPGPLRAILETDFGALSCELYPNEAPIGVANFVGLARGTRAWKDPVSKKWVKRRYYDGLTFHRVIDDFVIQGGDPLGTGTGGPGYKFVNEVAGLTHLAGTLAYANAGPNTNGSQFYICETPQPGLDTGYTIFGQCEPVSVVSDIAAVETNAADKPVTPVILKKVSITRCAP
jgi:peptidyl-prolyl cis-trans isomerase A (cyclophilin A)